MIRVLWRQLVALIFLWSAQFDALEKWLTQPSPRQRSLDDAVADFKRSVARLEAASKELEQATRGLPRK